ncbi:MAG: hypothetical protein ACI4DS_05760 [Eubacterium sp.]
MGVLAIYDIESRYANNFVEYLLEKQGIPFSIYAFTNEEALQAYAVEHYIDILLISCQSVSDAITGLNIGKIIMLTEDNTFSEYNNCPAIYKYQSTENILREVMSYYADTGCKDYIGEHMNKNVEIIGVYSPVGRCGRTAFSFTMGQVMAGNSRTLYINFEEFSGFSRIFKEEYISDLSDLMYFYRQNPIGISAKLKAMVNSAHNLDYVPPMVFSGDLRNVDVREWINLITDIVNNTEYKIIILDLSNMVKDVFELLEICTCIYVPIENNNVSLMKISEMEEFLLKTGRENIVNKMEKISIPDITAETTCENYLEQLVWGTMGDYVRHLLEENNLCRSKN